MAMDYETPRGTDNEPNTNELVPEIAAIAAAAAQAGATPLVPGPDNVIVLPAGVTLDDIEVQGRDLVITLDNGQVYVIPEGAIYVPQIVLDGVAVPPMNLAALLNGIEGIEGEEFTPEAGPTRSSGGNFADPVNPIGPAFGLGDLLPYTELAFPQQPPRDIIPGRINRPVNLTLTPGNSSVDEAGLPVRGAEPAGSNSAANSETTTGVIRVNAPDGLASVTVNGTAITAVGQTIVTARGTMTITSIAGNEIGYSYTLADNTSGDNTSDTFNVVATDTDGDSDAGVITISIVDDTPTARNDTDAVAPGTYGPESGNVITGANTTSGAPGADTPGADGITLTGFRGGNSGAFSAAGATVTGTYGTLTFNANGTYTYTRNAGTPGGVNDVFSYQITDSDGDTSTATLTISIGDVQPQTNENATVRLDDDALAGGNPGGTGDDVNAANTTGTLGASGGDGPLVWSLNTSGAPAGFSYVANGTGIDVFQGATKVLAITLNTATGAYTVTQVAPIVHAAGSDENNQAFTLSYTVRDQDGDTANGVISINVDDDTPVTANDTDTIASGTYGPATGNVLTDASAGDAGDGDTGADSVGADGGLAVTAITGAAAGTVGGTTAGAYGVLTLNADGSYTYTRNAGTPGGVNDVFTYTVTDADGDTATATLTIAIADALPLTGQNAQVQLDDDAQAGGNPGGTGDDPDAVNVAGTLAGSGGDGPLTWQMTSFTSPIGFSVTLVNQGLLEIFQGATKVFSITLNTATGAYTVTQHAAIDQSALGDENNSNFTLGYRVTDQDGDIAGGSLSITIDDDTPVVADDTDSLLLGATGPATGNVLTDASAGDAGDGDTGADSMGADGGSVTRIDSVNVPANFDDTLDGSSNLTVAGQYGTLTINADGSYSYTRNNGAPLDAVDVFSYTVTDGDGDTATATLSITIQDAGPVTGKNATVLLDDDALAGGNPGGTDDDVDSANATGFLAGSGGDGALTWTMTSFTSPIGFSVTLVNSSLLEIFQGATKVFSITLNNATGTYTVVQHAAIDHTALLDENNTNFTLGYRVTDADGDIAGGSIGINIDDDTPLVANDTDELLAGFTGPATGNVLTDASAGDAGDGDTGADSLGADGGSVTRIESVNVPANFDDTLDASDNLTVAGQYGTLTINADGSYSYTRNNGAPLNAVDTFTYTVTDGDGDTATATLTITIQDAGPVTGQNAAVQLDDDAQAGGNPGGTGDDIDSANATGFLAGSGGDGALTWTMTSFTSPIGFNVTLVNAGLLEIRQGTTLVFTITLDNATGAYTVTQVAPIDHTALLDENNTGFTLGYRVTDADGDIAGGSIAINIDDDTPVVSNDTDSLLAGATGPATGNVLTDASAGDAGDGDTGADSLGADGGSVTRIDSVNVPANFDDTLDGSDNLTVAGQYGTLTINADGSYSYTRNNGAPLNAVDTFTYTVTDGDGDTATATLAITIEDAGPVTGQNATVLLDDDAMAGGNPGGVGDDVDSANATGFLAGSGGDGALTWTMTSFTSPIGFSVTLVNPGLLEIYQNAVLVMSITLNNATGAYTVTQHAAIDHTALLDENNTPFTLGYRVTDADGDIAGGSIGINIDDDTPVLANDTDELLAGATGPATGNVLTDAAAGDAGDSDTGADSLGADGGSVTRIDSVNVPANFDDTLDGSDNLTVAGQYGTLTINADGSYSYTRFNGAPLNAVDTFQYTVTDGDGDTATATLAITIQDAGPVTGANGAVQLDDDAMAGGNPGGTGDDPDSVNASGFLAGSGGDGALTWNMSSFTSPAGFNVSLVNPGLLEIRQGTTLVFTITLDNATGAYTVTQVAPIDHTALLDENNTGFTLGYRVTDADGDIAGGTLSINIDDDTPVVANDLDTVSAGSFTPATGNVLTDAAPGDAGDADTGADSLGADGGKLTGIASDNVPANTDTTADGSGNFSVAGQYGVLTINEDGSYSYVRNAGTVGGVSDVFTYTVTDGDGDTAEAKLTITIADAQPVTGPNALVQLDDDAQAGGNPGGIGDDPDAVNVTGTLAGSGGDGALTWQMTSFTSPAGFTVQLVNQGLLEIKQGGVLVMTITLNTATGAYTVTQNAPIDHSALGDENNAGFSLGYRVFDADGDQAFGSIGINIDDDTPVVSNDTDSVAAGTYGPVTGNVVTDAAPGDAGDSDTGADSLGADGAAAAGPVTAITGFGGAGTIGGATVGQYGVLTINADGSYSYTRNAGTVGGVSDVFTYTVTDGDGDTAQATLTIDIADAKPVTAANLTVLLDDDTLAGGNAGGTGDDANAANVAGVLAASGGDGPLTWALDTTGAPAGFSYVANGTGIDVFQGATKVLAITLNTATGGYTVTQVAPIEHVSGLDENNQAFALSYTVTDQDGDTATGTLSIDVDDDSPVAANDTDVVTAGSYGPATGNILTDASAGDAGDTDTGADSMGADGGTLTAITGFGGAGTVGGTTTGQYGVLTLNADGSYSYARNAGTPGGVSDVFTYTITDSDGDTATATLTIAIEDARPVTAANGAVQMDDDALAGGNPGGTGDDADAVNLTGTLAGSGGDGPLSWDMVSFTSPGGTFSATLVTPSLLEIRQSGTLVYTITLNNSTGAYTVTQVAPIDHTVGGDENNFTFTLGYRVTDQDGDIANGTLSIDVDDDTPVVANDTDTIASGTFGPATGNVLTDADAGDAGDSDTGADSMGADGGTLTAITGFGGAGTIGGTTTGQYGVLTLNADGSYSYTRNAGTPGGVSDVFTYTVTDGDGDTAQATLTITIADAIPLVPGNAQITMDDDTLAGGNPGGTGDDATANLTGFLSGSGGDGALTWSMVSFTSPGVTFTPTLVTPSLLEIRQNGTLVFTITLNNATGAYVATQVAPIQHLAGFDENNFFFSLGYSVTDADGDSVAGSIAISVDDDTPVLANDTDSLPGGSNGPATGNVLTDAAPGDAGDTDTGADSLGADGGSVTAITGFGGAGTIGGTTNGQYGVLTLNSDGSYSYTRNSGTPGNVSDVFTYTVTDGDGDTATATLTITISDAAPVTTTNLTVLLDDDALTGGIAGGTGDDVNAANTTGTLSGSGGDGALTWAMQTTGAPAGFSYVANGTGIDVFQGATKVLAITLNAANGAYTVTQVAPIQHAAGGNENNQAFTLNYTVTDSDGDSAGGTLAIDVDDDTPTSSASTTQPILIVDETVLATNASASFASVFTNAFGADGAALANSVTYALGVVAGPSGLIDVATGSAVNLVLNGTVVEGRSATGNFLVFTLSVDTGGTVTLDQIRAVQHNDPLDPDEPGASAAVLSADNLITLTATATDRDGDTASATANIGGNLQFEDAGPTITSVTTPLAIVNSGSVSATGNFVFSTGSDGAAGVDDAIQAVTFSGTVNGVAVTSPTITPISENATSAVFNFSFTYSTGPLSTATANGVLTFNKAAGTYTVDLDAPIQGFSINQTSTGTLFQGYELNSSTLDGSQPAVSVTQIAPSLFIQYTGVQGASTTVNYSLVAPPSGNGVGGSWVGGELFSAGASWVSTSNSANGVAGDTIGGNEILDFNLYNTNPTGFVGTPTGNAEAMFLKFDGIGSAEDFIVILKLYDPVSGLYTSKALMVQNSDIQKGPGSGSGVYSGITLDNNDGLIVIEGNDYNSGAENWKIVGAQIVVDPLTITGTAINFNNATGVAGASSGTQSFATDTNTGSPMKISSIGFLTNTTTAQSAQLTFNVTVQDRDGDTVAQTLVVNVGSTPPVVLDLDGDGVEFVSTATGVAFDYNGDGSAEGTAWAGRDDGLLAIDLNGDGLVNDGSELIFAGAGQTDLEGLAAKYDSNADGVLDASDADFASFGVWQDADSDGVTDAGEFRSLTDLGITSIALASDGEGYTTADGDVVVNGQAVYTRADGTNGTVADAAFAIIEQARQAARTTELAGVAAATGGFLASTALAAAMPAADDSQAAVARIELHGPQAEAVDTGLAPAADGFEFDNAGNQPIHDQAAQLETAGHDWADGMADALARIDMGALTDRIAEMAGSDGNADRFAAIADAIGSQFSIGSGSLGAVFAQDLPAFEAAMADVAGADLVDALVDHFAANDAGPGHWVAPASDFALQGLLDTAVGDAPQMNFSGADLARMMFNSTELADTSHG